MVKIPLKTFEWALSRPFLRSQLRLDLTNDVDVVHDPIHKENGFIILTMVTVLEMKSSS